LRRSGIPSQTAGTAQSLGPAYIYIDPQASAVFNLEACFLRNMKSEHPEDVV
jgi:hypothetical protein